ncbi:MAG: UDP-N-acetylmuramoyl-tripeptide--D-alanyl-D-alanine ligase [Pseudomonadota bacterium]
MRAGEIAGAVKGKLYNEGSDPEVSGASIDSRSIKAGDMFIALRGENFDGHDFIDKAIEHGAVLVITEKDLNGCGVPYILVEDSLKALQEAARHYRSKFHIPFVAVTGSSGKTTTKDMIASVLSQKFSVLKTEGNLNNAIGLPLMLLRLNNSHEIAVLEMGMNTPGEIKLLADIVRHHVAVISNVGTAHIEYLGSRENILKAKLEIFTYFNKDSIAVINGDNDMLAGFDSDKFGILRYGLEDSNDIIASGIEEKGEDGIDFNVDICGARESFTVPIPGIHNVYNALSAISVARLFGLKPEEIRKGLINFKPSKNRMDIINTKGGIRIINDVYNANPDSMRAAINVLQSFSNAGRKVLITADMLELGEASEKEHYRIGEYAAELGIDMIASVGNFSQAVIRGAEAAGVEAGKLYAFNTKEEAAPRILELLQPGDTVLIKGSRGMKMEYVVDYIHERG